MKIIFIGNDLKYETEAVMKLFLPAQSFEFEFGDSFGETGDETVVCRSFGDGFTELSVGARYNGEEHRESSRLEGRAGDEECETELSRLLYLCMSRLTGIYPEWGILTGVRPVKQMHRLLDSGLTREQAFELLGEKYFVSEKKSRLAYDTASAQLPYLERLEKSGGSTFGLYVSIPFCPTRCAYCSFISQSASGSAVKKLIPVYVEDLCRELGYIAELTSRIGIRPDAVYFGGGTPTTLSAPQLGRIMKTIAERFDMSAVREYTVEAGRPDTITPEKLETIRENGCTRISINPQTLDGGVLEAIGRSHTPEQFFESFKLARSMGFDMINTDVIAGLPTDTPEGFRRTINGLLALSPENITVHTLSIKRSSRLNQDGKEQALKSPAAEMVEGATAALYNSGYLPYYMYRQKNMVDNLENIGWAKAGCESLYNIYIMEEVQTIIAAGAAGSTKLIDRENGRLERIFNYKYPMDYSRHFELMLKRKDRIEEFYAEKE